MDQLSGDIANGRLSVLSLQPLDPADNSCSIKALQQDLEELRSVNASLRKENHSLREQLNTAKTGHRRAWTPRLRRIHAETLDWDPSLCFRGGGHAWSRHASQLRCRVRSRSQGFLPRHDLGQGAAAAPAQTQAQRTYARLLNVLHRVYFTLANVRVAVVSRRSLTCWDSGSLWTNGAVCSETSQSSWNSACPHSSKMSPPLSDANENVPESGLEPRLEEGEYVCASDVTHVAFQSRLFSHLFHCYGKDS